MAKNEGAFTAIVGNKGVAYGAAHAGAGLIPENIGITFQSPTLQWHGANTVESAVPAGEGQSSVLREPDGPSALGAVMIPEGTYHVSCNINMKGIAALELIWEFFVEGNPTGILCHVREGDKAITCGMQGVMSFRKGEVITLQVRTVSGATRANAVQIYSIDVVAVKVDRYRNLYNWRNTGT